MTNNQVSIEERVVRLTKRSFESELTQENLKLIISMLDLAALEENETEEKAQQLCMKAMNYGVAAVCVYPNMVSMAKRILKDSTVKVASVAGDFPRGASSKEIKIVETKYALSEGADEIDIPISRVKFLDGEYNYVFDEIAEIKSVCGKALLKVILETGELGTLDNIRKASDIATHAGADFIKTSTGKTQPGATLPATLVMLDAIHDSYRDTGKRIGIKPAGGIRKAEGAVQYFVLVRETLGNEWLTPDLFRFGASSLIDDLVIQIEKNRVSFP